MTTKTITLLEKYWDGNSVVSYYLLIRNLAHLDHINRCSNVSRIDVELNEVISWVDLCYAALDPDVVRSIVIAMLMN